MADVAGVIAPKLKENPMAATKSTAPSRVDSPLKWHGGKSYLASRIVAMMPPHLHYVEPYAGGLSVLLAKESEGVSEVVNDIDRRLANFWNTIKHPHTFEAFRRIVEATPFGEYEWETAASLMQGMGWSECDPEKINESSTAAHVARASWFYVACRQSLAGRMDTFAPLSRTRVRRGMNEQASAWLNAVDGLPEVHARLKRVVVLNQEATKVIASQDGPSTLFYLDPPYLKETRTSGDVYEHEMTAEQHQWMLMCCTEIKGKFLLSGYPSELYEDFAKRFGWHRTDFDLPNSAGGKAKRRMTECVWTNFAPAT